MLSMNFPLMEFKITTQSQDQNSYQMDSRRLRPRKDDKKPDYTFNVSEISEASISQDIGMDEEEQYVPRSNSASKKKIEFPQKSFSHSSLSINVVEMAKQQLLQYDDINDEDFELQPDTPDYQAIQHMSALELSNLGIDKQKLDKIKAQYENYSSFHNDGQYMNTLTNSVPLGEEYQAKIPPLMSSRTYLNRHSKRAHIQTIHRLKVHDVKEDPKFYERYHRMIAYQFGREDLTYEDVILIKRAAKQFLQREVCNFEEYLAIWDVQKFWEEYFLTKDKLYAKENKGRRKRGRKTTKA